MQEAGGRWWARPSSVAVAVAVALGLGRLLTAGESKGCTAGRRKVNNSNNKKQQKENSDILGDEYVNFHHNVTLISVLCSINCV